MNENTVAQIQEALQPVAAKIGEGAEYSWELLVWGQFAEGVANLAVAGLLFVFVAAILYFAWRKREWICNETDGVLFIPFFLLIAPVGFMFDFFYRGMIAVIAPEYAALKFLLNLIGG